jgi:hypothetical protein
MPPYYILIRPTWKRPRPAHVPHQIVRPRSIDLTGTRNLIVTHSPTPWRSTTWWHLTIRAVGSFPSTADPASYPVAAERFRRPAPSSGRCHANMWDHAFLGPHVGSMRGHTEASHGKRGGTPRGLADREHRPRPYRDGLPCRWCVGLQRRQWWARAESSGC